jgi:hypothetical protein
MRNSKGKYHITSVHSGKTITLSGGSRLSQISSNPGDTEQLLNLVASPLAPAVISDSYTQKQVLVVPTTLQSA